MDEITFLDLDLPRVLDRIGRGCLTDHGRRALAALRPATEVEAVLEARRLVQAVWEELVQGRDPPEAQVVDPLPAREGLGMGSPDGRQLRELASYLSWATSVRSWLEGSPRDPLRGWAQQWPDLGGEAREILHLLGPDGLPDPARNPSLARLQRELASRYREREEVARRLLRDPGLAPLWQDSAPVDRGGRLLLPLRVDFKGRVEGVVHALSHSGQTLFVEPLDLLGLNNEVISLQEEYRLEINRILARLERSLLVRLEELDHLLTLAGEWESVLARARWGLGAGWGFPACVAFGEEWELLTARHPLLGEGAVSFDLRFPAACKGLVVSGPNTGGKTVLLKTLAVLSWINQLGCPVPCSPSSRLVVFRGWEADVGDHQSLAGALSTFSARLVRYRDILASPLEGTFLLLDELGSGTDPDEGGALALALLEELGSRGAFTVVSTHLGRIKTLPLQNPAWVGVGMEFDEQGGRPTYRVRPSLIGRSHALRTAEALGLPAAVLERAWRYLDDQTARLRQRLERLDEEEVRLRLAREEVFRREEALASREQELDHERRNLLEERSRWERERLDRLEQELASWRREVERLIRGLETREGQAEARRWLAEKTESVRAQVAQIPRERRTSPVGMPGEERDFRGSKAVLEKEVRPGVWRIRCGALRLEVPVEQLGPVSPASRQPTGPTPEEGSLGHEAVLCLDLRGLRVEEAVRRLDRQIERALLEGLSEFQVIHGLGEGKLQRAVHDFLRGHPHVRQYFFARPEEGGFGKTIVRLS